MGFFTDTSVCIGCKACEVACKEWNAVPEDGLLLTGMSYDNTGSLSALDLAARGVHRADRAAGQRSGAGCRASPRRGGGDPLADVQRRVQALHRGRLPGRLPDRGADAHRVRHRGRPGRRLQRLRLLRVGLPVRRHRPAGDRRRRAQVHAVLRPARRRPDPGLRQGLPDRVHPVRARWTSCGSGPGAGERAARVRRSARRGCTARTRRTASAAAGAFFLLLDEPEVYGLPPDPVVTTRDLPRMWRHVATAGAALAIGAAAACLRGGGGRDRRTARAAPWTAALPAARRPGAGPGPGAARPWWPPRAARSRWCRAQSPIPTTAARCSRSRCGRRLMCPATCSSAGWPARPRRWRRSRTCPATASWPGRRRSARRGRSGCPSWRWCTTSAARCAS